MLESKIRCSDFLYGNRVEILVAVVLLSKICTHTTVPQTMDGHGHFTSIAPKAI